jgi:carbamoyl-phosphate synthase large subunit
VLGVIVQLGGQTPLGLARALAEEGVPILGTAPDAIDLAEERGAFGSLLMDQGLNAPEFGMAVDISGAQEIANRIGYPVLVRPSFVLGGRGMEIVYDDDSLASFIERATEITPSRPVLIDKFLDSATEVDVDALFDGDQLFMGGVMEHIEEAGVHSGDSACVIPPQSISDAILSEIEEATFRIARSVGVRGLINIQFAIAREAGKEKLFVLEANPRASRTVPFVSKATGYPLAKAAAQIAVGVTIAQMREGGLLKELQLTGSVAVKEAVLPWNRFRRRNGEGVDTVLGPEMKSTGEVMGIAPTFGAAFAKSQISAFGALPRSGSIFVSLADKDKEVAAPSLLELNRMGYAIYATAGTHDFLSKLGVPSLRVRKHFEASDQSDLHSAVETALTLIGQGVVNLVVNTPFGRDQRQDGRLIRTAAIVKNLPCLTTVAALKAAVEAMRSLRDEDLDVKSLQDWLSPRGVS